MKSTQRLALLATIIGSAVVFLDGTVVNLALPKIATELHASFAGLQWVMDGYLLTLSALILLGGSLGDIFGRKKIYLIGIIGFALSSLACALAPSLELLIVMRLVQGIFGALVVPGALAIIDTNFTPELRPRAVAQWTAWTSAISAVGPLIGGWLVDNGSWRYIFLINVPLLIICYILGKQAIAETRDSEQRKVDFTGAALAIIGLGGVTYGLIEGPALHWPPPSIVAFAGGLLALGLFIWYEQHAKDPMLKLDLFASRNFTGANVATFLLYGGMGGFFFVFVVYLQTVVGFSSVQAGVTMLPVTLLMVAFSGMIGKLASTFGPRLFMTAGPILAGIGLLLLLPVGPGVSYWTGILPGILLFGAGLTITVAPLTATVLSSVTVNEAGIASAINNAVSRVSGLIVIALLGLFGSGLAYQPSVLLCGGLAVAAGIVSLLTIRNHELAWGKKSH